jgi:glycosyltransferase involved in cell wall biosynthesis
MEKFRKKEEYIIFGKNKNFKKYSIKNRVLYIEIKSLLYIVLLLLITISLNISKSETYTLFENGNKITYLKKEMVDKFNLYTNNCMNNILIDKRKYPLVKRPKISVIIPIYNGGKYLHYSLRSVQNQKMKDIEIILIDDCSTDNTLAIIEKYMKEDERIRFIKNVERRKILYSKSFAALNSKGKYIIQLDQDDIFIRDDIFDILYNQAKKEDLDLIQVRDFKKYNFSFEKLTKVNLGKMHMIYPKKTHYQKQPKLKDEMFYRNKYLLWGLLIKSDIYKKALYHLWPIIINYKIIYEEDFTVTFMIIILSKKYKYLNNFALIRLIHSNSYLIII